MEYTGSSVPDENGTYNGFLGKVQRNEVDISIYSMRTDEYAFEPGKPTSPVQASDLAIFSIKPYGEKVEARNLLSFLDLGLCIYMYLLTTCFFIAPMILAFCQSNAEERMKCCKTRGDWVRKFIHSDVSTEKYCYAHMRVVNLTTQSPRVLQQFVISTNQLLN